MGGGVLTSRNNDKELTGHSPDFAQRKGIEPDGNTVVKSLDDPKGQNRSFSQHLHLAKTSPKEGSLAPRLQRELLYQSGYCKYPLKGPRQESVLGSPGETSLEDESSTPQFIQGSVLGNTMKKFYTLFTITVHRHTVMYV